MSWLPVQMVDVGCGIGGSSRHIIQSLGGTATGISLSPVQVGHLLFLLFGGVHRVTKRKENKPRSKNPRKLRWFAPPACHCCAGFQACQASANLSYASSHIQFQLPSPNYASGGLKRSIVQLH